MEMLKSSPKAIVNHGETRIALVIVGIVIAFLCALALIGDAHSMELFNADVPHQLRTSRLLVLDFVGKAIAWL